MGIQTVSQSILNENFGAFSFRNRIINGDFSIWQRGTSRTFMSGGSYLADRWCGAIGYQNAGHQRVSVSSPPTGLNSQYAIRVSSSTTSESSGGTRLDCGQKIENINCYDLAGRTATVSFWMRASAATLTSVSNSTNSAFGDWTSRVQYNSTTTDSAIYADTGDGATTVTSVSGANAVVNNTQIRISNGSLPTTWTKYTYTISVPSGTKNLTLRFATENLGSTASADTVWYEIAQVQLEESSVATPFEHRPYSVELQLCQRYYGSYPQTNGTYWYNISSGGYRRMHYNFPVIMRTGPTCTVTGATNNNPSGSLAIDATSVTTCVVSWNHNASDGLVSWNSSALITASAEL